MQFQSVQGSVLPEGGQGGDTLIVEHLVIRGCPENREGVLPGHVGQGREALPEEADVPPAQDRPRAAAGVTQSAGLQEGADQAQKVRRKFEEGGS